ncbi:unnamed protein product [Ilex paraguariensis]|uniref:Uncharacterized protein n=1 Tax=Ilex paraguariensis TaxID=185542 RepID=A0ABC8UUF9_9AQUA
MRQSGHYGDSGGNAYVAAQTQNMSVQRMEHKSGQYQGRPESLASEKDHSYGTSKADGHLRWQRDGSKAPNAMSSPLYNDGKCCSFVFVIEMRQSGHYGDSGGNAYVAAQTQNMSVQRMEHKSGQYQGRPESLASEKDHSYGTSKADGHLRWQRDGSKAPNAMSSPLYNDGKCCSFVFVLY